MNRVIYETWYADRVGMRTSLSHKFFYSFTTATVGYKFERVNLTDIDSRVRAYFRETGQLDPQLVSQPSFMLGRDTRDSLLDPTSGYNLNFFSSVTPMVL